MIRLFSIIAVLQLLAVVLAEAVPPSGFESGVRPLLEAHCFDCHNDRERKGDVDFASLHDSNKALSERKLWQRAIEQIEFDAMPPDSEDALTEADKAALLAWMRAAVDYVDPDLRDPGAAPVRRLSRVEYENTLRDLTGIDFYSEDAVGMPDDEMGEGFKNRAAALAIPQALFEKYVAAADAILDVLFAAALPESGVKLDGREMRQAREAYAKLMIAKPGDGLSEREAAEQILRPFLRRAYRRPLRDGEAEKFLTLFALVAAEGGGFDKSVRAMLKPVLVSPNFLFRIEGDQPGASEPYRIGDHELAVRLSYFLWQTMPDEELSRLADEGTLSEPETLDAQVARMLADPRAKTLTEQFGEQWLQLHLLDDARPSTQFYPAFNGNLRRAMREEVTTFFDTLRAEDRNVLELLDADYTFVNADLAKHYGLGGVEGREMRRISLNPGDHRGGLLGMGAVLAMTSHTFRTSPTQRGRYILDVILGTPPPPPPPEAGKLENDNRGDPRSFREQIAQHAGDASCAGCHNKMDPLGFALDNYDAVGAWRVSTPEKPLDVSGQLPSGETFSGIDGLKKVLAGRHDQFTRNLVEQALGYALGREIAETDELAVRTIQSDLAANGHRFSEIITGVVQSYPFQLRKNHDHVSPEKEVDQNKQTP